MNGRLLESITLLSSSTSNSSMSFSSSLSLSDSSCLTASVLLTASPSLPLPFPDSASIPFKCASRSLRISLAFSTCSVAFENDSTATRPSSSAESKVLVGTSSKARAMNKCVWATSLSHVGKREVCIAKACSYSFTPSSGRPS